MGDFFSTAASGLGSSLGSLFGLGTAAAPTATDATGAPVGFDPASGLAYPTSTYDPTGGLGAQASVTGSYAPNVGPSSSDTGGTQDTGTQTGNTAGKSDASQPASTAPSGPAPVTPQSIAAMMQGQPLPTQPASNPWQPGGGQPTDAQRQAALDALRQGQGIPTGRQPGTPFADRYGEFQPPTSQQPPYFMQSAAAGPSGPTGDFPPTPEDVPTPKPRPAEADDTDDSSQDGKAAKPPAATPPPPAPPQPRASQPGMGQGGMPGGVGGLLQDIAGLMSGNPMALGKLVQDLMRGMGPQVPGWNQPFMQPNQASPYTQAGDPSTFGGPQYAGMVPGGVTPSAGTGPQFRPGIGPGQQPPVARTGVAPPGPGQRGPITPLPPSMQRIPDSSVHPGNRPPEEGAWLGRPGAGPPPARFQSAPAAAGPQASTPLARNEASVPDWAQSRIGGAPPMRPSQPSVDRSRFQKEANDETIAQAAWMVNGEVGLNTSTRAQIVQLETAFNRAQTRGTTLKHALLPSLRRGDPGYYDGISSSPTYGISRKPTPQQIAAFKQNVWDPVMKGSNLSDVGWGPMTGNASGKTARDQLAKGTKGYKMAGGDTYFREGPFRNPLPTVPQQMAQQ